jgi:hypothetical protein
MDWIGFRVGFGAKGEPQIMDDQLKWHKREGGRWTFHMMAQEDWEVGQMKKKKNLKVLVPKLCLIRTMIGILKAETSPMVHRLDKWRAVIAPPGPWTKAIVAGVVIFMTLSLLVQLISWPKKALQIETEKLNPDQEPNQPARFKRLVSSLSMSLRRRSNPGVREAYVVQRLS